VGARVRKVESGGWMVAVVVGELEEFEVRERRREELVGVDILMFICFVWLFGCLWRESGVRMDGYVCVKMEEDWRERAKGSFYLTISR
jgi:hypothetical protein